jgi:hypothetical protein
MEVFKIYKAYKITKTVLTIGAAVGAVVAYRKNKKFARLVDRIMEEKQPGGDQP